MAKYTPDQIQPMPGWALCRMLPTSNETASGLFMGRDVADGKVSEGVCTVLAVSHARAKKGRGFVDPGFKAGDRILFREFLKNANQLGDLFDEKANSVFLMNNRDALAVISGDFHGTLGHYGEFQL